MNLEFYDQLEGEECEFSFGQHWYLVLMKTFVFIFLMLSIIGFSYLAHVIFFLSGGTQALELSVFFFGFALLLALIHRFFLWILSHSLSFVIVTSYRIIIVSKSIFIRSEKEVLDLVQIRDIQMKKRGLWGNILEYGDINLVLSAQGEDTTVLHDVPRPSIIQEKCNAIRHKRLVETGKRSVTSPTPEKTVLSSLAPEHPAETHIPSLPEQV